MQRFIISITILIIYFMALSLSAADFVLIQSGKFVMGDTSDAAEADEMPFHEVTLSDFYLSPFEVTQKEWQDVMENNPAHFKGDNLPVENVSWYEAIEFCNKKSQKDGLTPCYQINGTDVICNFSANGYRLPTEAEWEFAARGGNKGKSTIYSGSNDAEQTAWYTQNSKNTTHPVGKKNPNESGLYDMSGNVYEWTWTRYHKYPVEPETNPVGPDKGSHRMFRGGSWFSVAENLRVSFRNRDEADFRSNYLGFRLCRTK